MIHLHLLGKQHSNLLIFFPTPVALFTSLANTCQNTNDINTQKSFFGSPLLFIFKFKILRDLKRTLNTAVTRTSVGLNYDIGLYSSVIAAHHKMFISAINIFDTFTLIFYFSQN